jgi:hypothetical protein
MHSQRGDQKSGVKFIKQAEIFEALRQGYAFA